MMQAAMTDHQHTAKHSTPVKREQRGVDNRTVNIIGPQINFPFINTH